jgi:hypothetical protein
MKLIINNVLKDKLGRINSPIAQKLLGFDGIEHDDLSISYLGISQQNPSYISYLDQARINRIEEDAKKPIYGLEGFKVKFTDKGFLTDSEESKAKPIGEFLHAYDADIPLRYSEKFEKICDAFSTIVTAKRHITTEKEEDQQTLFQTVLSMIGGDEMFVIRTNDLFGCHTYLPFEMIRKYCEMEAVFEVVSFNKELAYYDPKRRYHGSVGKITRRIFMELGESVDDKMVEAFVTSFKIESYKECGEDGDLIYEELKGEDIRWAYHEDNYYAQSGDLGNSCMRYNKCQDYLDIYAENPEKISLAVLKKEGKIAARSLLWDIMDTKNAIYHDRVYFIDEKTKLTLEAKLQSLGYKDAYRGDNLTVNLNKVDFTYYPYMDSFRCLSLRGWISTDSGSYDYYLDCPDGGPNNGSRACPCCGDDVDEDDLHHIDRGRYSGESLCGDCSRYLEDGDTVHIDNAQWCDYVSGYYHVDDCVELHDDNYAHMNDTTELYNGQYALSEDCVEIYDGRSALKDDTTEAVDGIYYLTDSIKDHCVFFEGSWYPMEHDEVEFLTETQSFVHINSEEYQIYLKELEQQQITENEQAQEEPQKEEITESTIQENTIENNEFIL